MAGAANWTFGREVAKFTGSTSGSSTVITLTAGASVPVGNVVVVWGMNNGGNITANGVSDSKANTWHLVLNTNAGGIRGGHMAWCQLTNAWTNTDTVTIAYSGLIEQAVYIADFTPPAAGTIAQDGFNSATSTSAAAYSSGAATSTGSDDLLIGLLAESGTTAAGVTPAAQTPSWTSPTTANQTISGATLAQWYALDAGAGSYTLSGTLSASSNYVAAILALTPPAAAVSDPLPIAEPHSSFGPF